MAKTPWLRVLDKESMSEKFHHLTLDVVGFADEDLKRFRRYIREPYGMVLVTGPPDREKHHPLRGFERDQERRRQDHHHRGPGGVPDSRHHADSGEREEGAYFCARPAVDSAPRSGQDSGGRDPRQRDGADCHQLRAYRAPGLHHRPRQQRGGRAGALHQHGVEAYNFVSALNCILAQRLVRTVCEYCAHTVYYDDGRSAGQRHQPAEWRGFGFREGTGCMECGGTGYRGRTAIHELLDLTDPIRELILEKKPTSEVRKLAQQEGMSFLRESALERVRRGLTTLKEINKVTFIEASR